jgi:predicted Zn finger-like uncharacterized protein
MNVTCGACPAKYVIPDEKVRGRKVRIPCKHCGAAIIVDGTGLSGQASNAPNNPQGPPAEPQKVNPPAAQVATASANPSPGSAVQPNPAAAAPVQAVRPQRKIRQTIIGVAAPANAPDSARDRPAPVRKPTPIYVRAPNADEIAAARIRTITSTSGQMRSIRRTMVGGLDSDAQVTPGTNLGAGEESATPNSPQAASPLHQKRDVKHTKIGGLEPVVDNASGPAEPANQPRPSQDIPSDTWLAALPDRKTLRLPEKDLRRAVAKGFVNMTTPFWQTGMADWVPLQQIPRLVALLSAPSVVPKATQNRSNASLRAPKATEAKATVGQRSTSPSPVRPATTKSETPKPAKTVAGRSAAPAQKVQPARPSPVLNPQKQSVAPRVPASTTVRPAASLAPGTSSVAPLKSDNPSFATAAPRPTRGPASLSARSSSPTLELVALDEDEIADVLAAQQSSGPQLNEPRITAPPTTPAAIDAETQNITEPSADLVEPPPTLSQRNRSKLPMVLLVVLSILTCIVASYVMRQPPSLYAYLHEHGWEQSIDRSVKRVTSPVAAQIRKWLKH